MKRITFHLSGVTPITVEKRVRRENGGHDVVTKKICMNTVAIECLDESEGLAHMAQYLENHKSHTVTKHYFSNIK